MMRKLTIGLFLILSVFFSCNNDDDKIYEKELLSFTFELANNQEYLFADIEAVIEGSNINLSIPEHIDITNLVASFEFVGEDVYVNDVLQISTKTKNNFSDDLFYEIRAGDGTMMNYRVNVEYLLESDLKFTSFSFKQEHHEGLSKDYELKFIRDTVRIQMRDPHKVLIATFETLATNVLVNQDSQISSVTENDFSQPITYSLGFGQGFEKNFVVILEWGNKLPQLYIETEDEMPIVSKDDYIQARLTIDGVGEFDDFEADTEIRGRGNSTWGRPKKPYRIKLNKKASILGLKEAKNWVLLANHFDETLMLNAVAMKIGGLLGSQYVNHIIPVELTINGVFMGNYNLTEQVEEDDNRVAVKNGGQLLELDSHFDEDWKFKSAGYNMPVMVKYPKLKNYSSEEAEEELNLIKDEYEAFESKVFSSDFPNTDYLDLFDQEAFVDYLIVYMLTANREINHPKSTFLHKTNGGKYTMGPIWDFDWAFSFDGVGKHFNTATEPLLTNTNSMIGAVFFSRLLSDPSTKQLLMQRWSEFKSTHFDALMGYVDDYAKLIEISQLKDRERWNSGSIDFEKDVNELKSWLNNRANYLDNHISSI